MDASSLTEGVDFTYHVWTNMSVRRVIIWGISVHSIHKEEVLFLSLVCTCKKASINKFEVYVDVQNGALRFRGKHLTIDVLVSSNSCCHPFLSYGNCPQNHLSHDYYYIYIVEAFITLNSKS